MDSSHITHRKSETENSLSSIVDLVSKEINGELKDKHIKEFIKESNIKI